MVPENDPPLPAESYFVTWTHLSDLSSCQAHLIVGPEGLYFVFCVRFRCSGVLSFDTLGGEGICTRWRELPGI